MHAFIHVVMGVGVVVSVVVAAIRVAVRPGHLRDIRDVRHISLIVVEVICVGSE